MMSLSEISRYISQVHIDTKPAKLLLDSEAPRLSINRQRGGMDMESEPIKLDIDNRAFFDSLGLKSVKAFADEIVAKGKKAIIEGMKECAQEAEILSRPKNDNAIRQISAMRTQKSIDLMLVFIPEERPKINWTGGTLDMEFTPDKLDINWQIQDLKGTYIPYAIEYRVE